MVEGARLESVCASNGTAGSNPVLSAKINTARLGCIYFACDKDPDLRCFYKVKIARFGAVNEVKSSSIFSRVSGEGLGRYPVPRSLCRVPFHLFDSRLMHHSPFLTSLRLTTIKRFKVIF